MANDTTFYDTQESANLNGLRYLLAPVLYTSYDYSETTDGLQETMFSVMSKIKKALINQSSL